MNVMTDPNRDSERTRRRRRWRRHLGLGPFPGRLASSSGPYAHTRTLLVIRLDGTIVAIPDWLSYEVNRAFQLTVTRTSGDALRFERDQWATYRYDD